MKGKHWYNRFLSSARPINDETRRDIDENICFTRAEKLEREIHAIERNNAALEEEICELRSAISRLEESGIPQTAEKLPLMEKQIHELTSALSRLELEAVAESTREDMEKLTKENADLKKIVMELTATIDQMEDALSSYLREKEEVTKLVEKNGELENKVTELTTMISRLKAESGNQKSRAKSKPALPYMSYVA